MIEINGETSVYGIIGDPVKHSLSPLFQNHFLQQHQSNSVYLPFHVLPQDLEGSLHGLLASHVQGLNVTVPHKENAMHLVKCDTDAQTIGAVNTLRREHDGWHATNTDWQGFASVLQGLQANVTQSPVLLFGAGGTSRAVCHALHKQGAKEVWICNRTIERAQSMIDAMQEHYPDILFKTVTWSADEVSKHVLDCNIMINTSSIGLGQDDIFPFSISGQGVAIDAVYKPYGETAFTKAATAGGFTAVDGLPMLIAQGIASFAYWHPSSPVPDKLEAFQWVEKRLPRLAQQLPGWRS